MASRATYTALTPEYAEFPNCVGDVRGSPFSRMEVENAPGTSSSSLRREVSGGQLKEQESDHDEDDDEQGSIQLLDHEDDEQAAVGCVGKTRRGAGRVLGKAKDAVKANTGLLLVAASQLFFSMMNAAVKQLNSIDPPVSTLEVIAVRMSITLVCCIVYMLATKIPDPFLGPKGVRGLLAFRGFIGWFGLFGVYYSLEYLSLSDATVLTFLSPMCTAIAGTIFLGENFTRREAFAGIVSLVGVILIARPTALFGESAHAPQVEKGTPTDRLVAVGVALIGVLGATGAYTTIRAIGKRAHALHSMVFFSTLCVVVSTIGMLATKQPFIIPQRLDWAVLFVLIGIFGFVAQLLLTMGLQRETAGRGSMAIYTQVVFASIFERVFFHAVPSALSVVGTVLILSSAIYVALTKNHYPENGQ
ncbi:hypothetical protein NLJ89_g9823 [Agrocybe chaxingu]|uniref:EamA domain-containing protein n=1 Tax=Agrocybe chaxingu TaxID=84603 RepID=A0A9W8JZA8_9AGAR|nr:hypothetical protein NLJ89_g9823 [Agrocybe chaxingu]